MLYLSNILNTFMNKGSLKNLVFIFLILCLVLKAGLKSNYAQNNQNKDTPACIVVSNNSSIRSQKPKGLQLENNTKNDISLTFDFEKNSFYNQGTLLAKIMDGTDPKKSKDTNQFIILDNIARIIKSPDHRNLHLIFSSGSSTVNNKKYSPLSMISSFYDKQCNDYQRLAAQMAILTPYFHWQDFKAYYILKHVVVDVKVGNNYIFHDFDPGEPGFRFYKNVDSSKFASFTDLMNDINLIKKEQFYTYNHKSLCPWISETYYRSLFGKTNGSIDYAKIENVYGFITRWVVPPGAIITTYFPDTTTAARFGAKVNLNMNNHLVRKAFRSYSNYKKDKNPENIIKINSCLTKYLKHKYKFGSPIDYFYLINAGLIKLSDSANSITTFKDNYINVSLTTNNDTLFFLKDFFLPLPLHKVSLKQGKVAITETEYKDKLPKDYKYSITDSLVLNLYNYSPPIVTSESIRNPPKIDVPSLIYGPSQGFISPHSIVEFEYYYNPFYYAFHDLVIIMRYEKGCDDKLEVKPIY